MKRVIAGIVAAAMLTASQASAVAPTVNAADRAVSEQGLASNGFAGMSPAAILILLAILGIAIGSYVADQDDTPTSP